MNHPMLSLHFDPRTPPATRRWVVVVLVAAVLGISSSAVIVRSMDASPLAIAAWRTLLAGVLLSPALRRGLPRLTRSDAGYIACAGVALGLHFWLWFASLSHTTVLRSTVLVCAVPLWTAGLEWARYGRRPSCQLGIGFALTVPGLFLMFTGADTGVATWTGDVLALAAGALAAVYMLLGRSVRKRVHIATYMGLVCFAAAALLLPVAALTGTPLSGFDGLTWGLLWLAVIGPQLVGHQGFNYALAYLPASTVSTLMLLEPVGAALLAAVVLREVPTLQAAAGGAVILAGVWVGTYSNDMGDSGGDHPSPSTST